MRSYLLQKAQEINLPQRLQLVLLSLVAVAQPVSYTPAWNVQFLPFCKEK